MHYARFIAVVIFHDLMNIHEQAHFSAAFDGKTLFFFSKLSK